MDCTLLEMKMQTHLSVDHFSLSISICPRPLFYSTLFVRLPFERYFRMSIIHNVAMESMVHPSRLLIRWNAHFIRHKKYQFVKRFNQTAFLSSYSKVTGTIILRLINSRQRRIEGPLATSIAANV